MDRRAAARAVVKDERVNRIRGVVMLLAAAVAFWKGWQLHRGETAILAYGLGAMALVIGVWHLTRREPKRVTVATSGSAGGDSGRTSGL
jgi:hypothetical protein